MTFCELAFHLLERPAEPCQRIRRNADARIGDRQHDTIAAGATAQRDAAPGGREFHRIGKKIERDLFDRATVGMQMQVG